ncbi:hypothetical protein BCR42DRAFT_428182 [Absidia repens]|uniref:Pentacotripeptide-repeat region of PRORP domain-containing protein n=1 Tax=Absidia repens TaxID=90262 RepID=A0A1X2HYQ3_9FUNG|nr:hypothetical protein BCR42DRAFT_428182 [Absidia repens]
MVLLRCHHLQSGVNQQVLQQWKVIRSAQCQSMRPLTLTGRHSFSSQDRKASSLNNYIKHIDESVTNNNNTTIPGSGSGASSAIVEQQKRQLKKRISSQVASKVDQHARSPVVLSLHTHLQRGEYDAAWTLMNQVTLQRQAIPQSTAQLLLESLKKQVHLQQPQLNGHNIKLQSLYLNRMEQLVNYLQVSRMTWDRRDLAVIFDVYGRLDRVDRAELIFRNWNQYTKHELTTDAFNKMLSMYLRRLKYSDTNKCNKYINKMNSLFQLMPRRGCAPDVTSYNCILAAKIKMNDFEGAESWFNRQLAIANNNTATGQVADRMTFHLMLQGAMKNGQGGLVNADSWIDRMIKAGLAPNRNTFKRVLGGLADQVAYFARVQDRDEMLRLSSAVKRLFGVMRKLHHQPDTALLNTLLKCYTITNQRTEIDSVLKKLDMPLPQQKSSSGGCSGCSCQSSAPLPQETRKMKKPKRPTKPLCIPDLTTFNTLIHYELKNDQVNNSLRWYDDMMRMNIQPDTVTYGTFIGYYINKGNVKEALRYYDVMEHKDIPGNSTIYNMLLKGAEQQPDHQDEIMERHRGLLMNMVDQNTVSFNTQLSSAISGVRSNTDMATTMAASDRFADVFEQMLAHDVIPNERTYNIALDIYGKLSRHNKLDTTISSIMTSMASINSRPDTITYALNIRNAIYQHNLPLAKSLLRSMTERGIKPNAHVFSHLIVGYVQEGYLAKARHLLTMMTQPPYNVKPTAHVFTPLVKGYAQNGDFDQAYNLFKDMLDQGVQPDIITYTILADMFVEHGSPKEAIRLLSGLKERAIVKENGSETTTTLDATGSVNLDHVALGLLMEAHGLAGQSTANSNNNDTPSSSSATKPSSSLLSPSSPSSPPSFSSSCSSSTSTSASSSSSSSSSPHVQAVQGIYASMEQTNPVINAIYLTAMARLKQPLHAWTAWQHMSERQTIHYNALLFGLAQNPAWYPTAKQVFDTMAAPMDGITFDAMTDAAILNDDLAFIRTDLWSSSKRPKPSTEPASSENVVYMLVKTYYKTLKVMLLCQDDALARAVYQESLVLSNESPSATVWRKEIHLLALANGLIEKPASSTSSSSSLGSSG